MTVRVNAAPIADAGPDLIAAPGEEVTLDGSGSVDPDDAIASWTWTFPDGSEAEGQRVAHTFATSGLQRVQLTVRDETGLPEAFDVDELEVAVNAPPVAAAGADLSVAPGDPVRLDGSASFDHDGSLTAWRWDFDDLPDPVLAATADRTWDAPGVHTAQLTVTDASGAANATATDEVTIRVNHAPVAEAGPEIVTDDLYVTLDGSASSDADGDRLIHTWDFGDGSPRATGESVKHAYPRSGIFPVTLTVDDGTGLGNATATDATRVLIDARPLAVAGGNRDVCSGDPILFDGSASSDPDGGLLRYDWDFGDGSRSDIVNPNKTYEQPGRLHRRPHRPRRVRACPSASTATASPPWCARRRSPTPASRSPPAPTRPCASTARARPTPTARSTPSPGTSATAPPAAASARPTSSSAPAPTTSPSPSPATPAAAAAPSTPTTPS